MDNPQAEDGENLYRSRAASEFSLPQPDGSREQDEVELGAQHGSGVLGGPTADVANDLLTLRQLQRSSNTNTTDIAIFGALVGTEGLRKMGQAAHAAGDMDTYRFAARAIRASNPAATFEAIFGIDPRTVDWEEVRKWHAATQEKPDSDGNES